MVTSPTAHEHAYDGPLNHTVCYIHSDQETALSCTQCNQPICTRCVVFAAVGQICHACARARRPVNYQVSFRAVCVATAVAFAASMAVCIIALLLIAPLPFLSLYLPLISAYFVAGGLARLIDRTTRAKRGRTYQIAVGVSLILGALPILLVTLLLFSFADLAMLGIFAATLVFGVMMRLR